MLGLALVLVVTVLLLGGAALLMLAAGRQSQVQQIDWQARISGQVRPDQPWSAKATDEDPLSQFLNQHLQRAGLSVEGQLLRRLLFAGIGLAGLVGLLFGPAVGVVMLLVEAIVATLWLLRRAARRRARILDQLPEFLEHMARSLTAGNSVEESLYSATADAEEPIRGLFLAVGRQVRLGAPIDDVLDDAAQIHGMADLSVMAMAARVNRRYGGSLKRIFKSLVQAIRERDAAARELRALTGETRFSALVLAVVPIGLTLYILLQNPEYYVDMWAQPWGRGLLLFSVLLQSTGVLVIWRMLHVAEERG